jgi:hypothetical protein
MPSQRQIEANRRNALRSTGPRTPQGKSIAARNHTLHGFSSPHPLLPDEDPAEFAASLAKWRNYWQPVGPDEETLVYEFAVAAWRRQRIPRLEVDLLAAAAKALSGPPGPLPKWGGDSFDKLLDCQESAERAYDRARRALGNRPARKTENGPSNPIPIMGRAQSSPAAPITYPVEITKNGPASAPRKAPFACVESQFLKQ